MRAALFALALGLHGAVAGAQHLSLWHAYHGVEQQALDEVLATWRRAHPGATLDVLALPFEAYASKLESAIPRDHGPDVFIDAHERLSSYRSLGLVAPLAPTNGVLADRFDETAVRALSIDGELYAMPLSVKCAALFINPALVPLLPSTLETIEGMRATLPAGVFPLVYESQSAYYHAALLHAYGGEMLDARGRYGFVGPAAERSVARVIAMTRGRVIPDEASGALVTQLFSTGRAATAISGPWLAADLEGRIEFRVIPLPTVRDAGGHAMQPYATVEGAFVSSRAHDLGAAAALAEALTDVPAAVVRARVGRQVVATRAAWGDETGLSQDPVLAIFRAAAASARPMPVHPHMRAVFEPARQAILRALRGDRSVRDALVEGKRRFDDVTRPLPPRRDATMVLLALGLAAMGLATTAVRRAKDPDFRLALKRSLPAYAWVAHAALTLALLVVVPLVLGAATSFYAQQDGRSYFVGLANYWDILTARGGPIFGAGSFYRVLGVTVLWTAANITLHVGLGVGLALLLSRPLLRMKALYRVLLIVPWAVPSYVTALAWRGMFHRQFGAVNALLGVVGVEPVSWFARFSTAFAANVTTNVWLGFPFMMVVTLGALAGIPKDLYEAAAVDGADAWQRFWKVTVPMLRPAMGPAVAMGAVWTFNQFNVVFLVSGGEPDGDTDILVSEAYRWAFTRQAQYGYASAYAVLIFLMLLLVTRRRGAEAA